MRLFIAYSFIIYLNLLSYYYYYLLKKILATTVANLAFYNKIGYF